ncbi:universal stress protein [Streptomyces boncukensis]|uniref:Universal stress protein n=1 Tax=Streptomyces boncukensis TaxID=2711219 RepID=A0A6G4WY70_9ACTN|nr:universal stress protein [Streptomyces boncukensis]NGO69812.1 universal stress protein [Streptomyces boncukensis]
MSESAKAAVVAGVDGSEASQDAVESAAREAVARGGGLHLVHAVHGGRTGHSGRPGHGAPQETDETALAAAHQLLDAAVERAERAEPAVEIRQEVVPGTAASVLTTTSHGAELVVVGTRGTGGFSGLLIGSVAVHLAAHAECPVLVTRGRQPAAGPVLLAVDGSQAGDRAVGFAFEEASLRGTDLVALHAWNSWAAPVVGGPGIAMPFAYDIEALRGEAETLLSGALAGWRERYPDVTVHPRVVQEYTREALIEASEEAQLLVVGARGRGGFAGLLLGSVSQALLHHAHCPVAVVRGSGADG